MIAGEVWDDIKDFPEMAQRMFDGRCKDPVEWANMWKELGADMIALRLIGTDPFGKNMSPKEAADLVNRISDKTNLPMMVSGSGNAEKDIEVLTEVCNSVKGTRLIISKVDECEYKKLSTAALANGHVILAFSNLDVNLAKQMNILLSDFGMDTKDMVMDPLMAALGMGLDYSYSVNERIRIAALNGDKMLQIPMVCDCTSSWEVNDATAEDDGTMGAPEHRAIWWEAITGMAAMISGADVLIVRAPGAADMLKVYACELTEVL
jgi:acetyl-CoA decarbonylase/synthase complex subunit delta